MGDLRLIRPQSSLSLLLIFKGEKRKGDAVILDTFSIRFFSLQLRVCSLTLLGFQILARRSLFTAAMLFFVSASLFSPKNVNNSLSCIIFRAKKNLAVSHLPLKALPAVQTWTPNGKRDSKTVVTWHSLLCDLRFPMKNLMLKVSVLSWPLTNDKRRLRTS